VPAGKLVNRRLEIAASGEFVEATRGDFSWTTTPTTQECLGPLETQSERRFLEPRTWMRSFDELAQALVAHGGCLTRAYSTRSPSPDGTPGDS
jgi:hypothetical protein